MDTAARGASAASAAVVADYRRLPDRHRSGRGMTAGGSLSPLLAVVMLISLDEGDEEALKNHFVNQE